MYYILRADFLPSVSKESKRGNKLIAVWLSWYYAFTYLFVGMVRVIGHLEVVEKILPYFFVVSHQNNAQCWTYHIDDTKKLPFWRPSKIYGVPGPGLWTGGLTVYLTVKKEGLNLFLKKETWGLVLFLIEKRRGPLFIFLYQKGGQQLF